MTKVVCPPMLNLERVKMKFLQAFVLISFVFAIGCTKEGEKDKVHFSGDFCEIEKRQAEPFPTGKETIVDALQPDDVLVAVNGYPLTKKTFDEVMVLKAKQLANAKGSNQAYLNNQLADFRRNYVPLFVNQRLLIDRARELNVIPKEELERRVNDIVEKQAKARKMTVEKFVRSFPGDFKYFLYETCARLLMNSIVAKHIPPVGEVSDGLVAAFQQSIAEDNAATMKTNEMKRVQMQEWKRDLLAKKVTFEELAKKYSEDDYADEDRPGYWGEFERGQIDDKRVQSVVFSLKPGEISDPVEDDEGFHLLKVLSVTAPERNAKGRVIQDEMRKVMHIFVKKLPLLIRDTDEILKADLKRQMQIQAINRYLDDLKTNGVTRIEFPHGKKLFE